MSLEILIPLWVALGILSGLGVAVLEQWALRNSVLDVPNARSSHERPTPRGGGLAVIAVIGLGWLALELWISSGSLPWQLAAGVAIVGAVSWLDDLRGVSNRVRFLAHAVAAAVVIWRLGFWAELDLPFIGAVPLGLAGAVASMLWMVGLTNAYNFMDGIDGIAAWQAIVAGLGWMFVGAVIDGPWVIATGGIIAAAAGAFLLFNWSPARIFMGDVGSASLGFLFAALPFVAMHKADPVVVTRIPVVAVLLVWPFVFDAVFTFIRRWRRGENVFAAHRSHLYQRLTIAGSSHRNVSTLYAVLASVGLLASAVWMQAPLWAGSTAVVVVAALAVALVVGVRRAERQHEEAAARKKQSRKEMPGRFGVTAYSGDGGDGANGHVAVQRREEVEEL